MNHNSEISDIKSVLQKQQIAWNNGNIDGFMLGYWNSEKLEFVSESGVTKGWRNTLDRYKNTYPNKGLMGVLQFEILDVKLLSETTANLKGKWKLIRKNDNPKGSFTLTFNKIEGQWLIIKDCTTGE
jgi:hypothetical protein